MTLGFVRTALAVAVVGLALSGAQAQTKKAFVVDYLASEAIRLEERLRAEAGPQARPALQRRREAEAALQRRNAREALTAATAAIATDGADGGGWLVYARAARSIEPRDWRERSSLQQNATAAAYQAYQRAGTPAEEAAALVVLGEVYAWREAWRPALNAYALSLALADNPAVRQTYEGLRARHGFRYLSYDVESDSAVPRVCFTFSEELARGRTDFAPYLVVGGQANAAVTAEGSKLCADGLRHGERYAFVLRQGLPSAVGEALLRTVDLEVYVRDRAPQVRFTGRNYVLPRTGQEGIPVVSVNTERVELDVYRIGDRSLLPTVRSEEFLNQLGGYNAEQIGTEKGFKVWSGQMDTRRELNREVTTAFPVLEAVGRLEPGVYVMTARAQRSTNDDDYGTRATQWFVVSDLGLTAFKGEDGVHVLVRSLAGAQPQGGVEVRLIARNNEVLGTRTTDAQGHARFDPGLARGTAGLAPGLVVATTAEGDYGFLDLVQAAFDLTDRGVKGRAITGQLEAFVYPERGVYRTGETVQITALLRDARGLAAAGLPVTLVVRRPDGVEYRRVAVEDQGLGGRSLSLLVLPGAMRGTYRIAAHVDPKGPAVGEATFLVEDYVPERLELTLAPRAPALRPGEPAEIEVAARYLFGAPGAGLAVSGEVTVQAAARSAVPGLEAFSVGLDDETVDASTAEIEERGETDPQGRVLMRAALPEVTAARPAEARVVLRVGEPGGRAVERSVTLPVLPAGPVLGLRKAFGDASLAEGATATFDVVAASPDGRRLARSGGVSWTLARVERRYQWFNSDGRWGYEPVKSARRVADGRLDLAADAPARIATPVEWGTYRLEVKADAGDLAPVSVTFSVGWGGDATADTPDRLEMTLDKAAYRAGETIRARLAPRSAGTATLAVVSDRVHEIRVVDVPAGGLTVDLTARAEWGSGAYLVALAHRPLDRAAQRMPGRALGVAWFGLDREARTLSLDLGAPAQMRPRGPLTLPIRLAGLGPGEEARVAVAAVDVGILNLTRYQTPNPSEFFFGQKQLATEVRDLYGYLIDGMQGTRGAIRAGGDAAAAELGGIPPTQEPVAFYSGVVRVGADGMASVTFDMPAFNGTARITGVAWTRDRVGAASADVIVRDPVVLAGTLPRFLSVGDQSRFHMQVENVEGAAGEYVVDLDVRGPVLVAGDALRRTIRLGAGEKGAVTVPVTAAGPGLATLVVRLTGPGLDASQSFALRVQPGSSGLVRRTVRPLEAGASLSLTGDLLADILPGTGAVSVSVSPFSAFDVPGLLQALDRYPYGCSEQTVSRALPLLYVNRLASQEALAVDGAADERVRGAIERVLSRQGSGGGFGLWSVGGEDDIWLDAYVTDFLTRARERGFPVPQGAFGTALDRLRNHVANTTEVDNGRGEGLAYAAYVLARNGRPVMGDLRYLADTKLSAIRSPLARAQIAAALALLGDRGRAQGAFASAAEQLRSVRDTAASRPDYGSRLRDGAGFLALVGEANAGRDLVPTVTQIVAQERTARTTSTQENAWMVLAAQALAADGQATALTVDGQPHAGAFYRTYREGALAARPVSLVNTGPAAQVVVTVTGNPVGPEPAASQGYAVERTFHTLTGERVDPASVRQNDRMVVVVKATEQTARYARLLLVDRLPAGFEIDNPKLAEGGGTGGLAWLGDGDVRPEHTEFRDDRFVAAWTRTGEQSAFLRAAYVVRAVTPGRYVHPPALIEDMYRPDRFGRTAFGTVEVAPAAR